MLKQILEHKRQEVERLTRERDVDSLRDAVKDTPPARGFRAELERRLARGSPGVIAEIKRASPSRGLLRADFDPASIATAYEHAGATGLSVLTDEHFFQGSTADFRAVRELTSRPLLRKDFILDPWQVFESRLMGADCVLLIAAALSDARLRELCDLAGEIGLDVLLEVHNADELARALETPAIIGINNRNLETFEVSLRTAEELAGHVPSDRLVVAESGIHDRDDVGRLQAAGINAFLVGEALMSAPDPGARLGELFKSA